MPPNPAGQDVPMASLIEPSWLMLAGEPPVRSRGVQGGIEKDVQVPMPHRRCGKASATRATPEGGKDI
ncbi:MAG: hypothetical protein A2W19_03945 [Spirochaetes bacterium RBG_16_49_21]|nr:MAG: hypothetical protein A2W19_03945 [Spirochaetes bacterium RBG_16_49_21]